mmetsp:Transcript_4018/g.8053  ORF Transcript_4018/g.8053 Transcript_4018/m.8053 type:complete len:398 (+) Transcript_4018:126-1319(+)
MIDVSPPAALIVQLSSLSFILCGLHNDLLVIRFYVTLAYALVITNVLLSAHQLLRLDSLGWAILGLYINGTSLFSLLHDERPVHLTEDQAALWRLLYRSGGFSARLFHSLVVPHLQVQEIPAGNDIPTTDWFYIVYTGRVCLQVQTTTEVSKEETANKDHDEEMCGNQGDGAVWIERIVQSGQMFDLRFLELFSDYSDHFFHKGDIKCKALTDCKLFCFQRSDIRKIAHHPLSKGVWQSLLINDISITAERFFSHQHDQLLKAQEYDRIFDPLQEWELPSSILPGSQVALRHPLEHFVTSLARSLRLPWPFGAHQAGIRQTLLPAPTAKPKPDYGHRPFYRRFGHGSALMITRSGWSMARSSRPDEVAKKSTIKLEDVEEGENPCSDCNNEHFGSKR